MMTIHLTKELETNILAAVHSGRYASLDDAMCEAASLLVERLKQEEAQVEPSSASQGTPAETRRPIWQIIEEENRSIPPEVWDALPADLSEHHDHYIYGTPKRPSA